MILKIFSLNCWLLPPPLSKHNKKRIIKIIGEIKKHKPEIISLQEVWLRKYVKDIERNLKDYSFIKSDSHFYNKGGLLTGINIKKFDFEKGYFPITKKYSYVEKIAHKGYHLIKLPNGKFFVNTHLYAPIDSKDRNFSRSQFKFLQKILHSKKGVLAGDLNLEKDEIGRMNTLFEFNLPKNFVPLKQEIIEKLSAKEKHFYVKIDYILKTKNFRGKISTKALQSPILSDHPINIAVVKL